MFNLVGSHDTIRIKKRLQDDTKRVKCAYVLMFTSPGTPTIYYGDEIGMTGDHDPDNRRCMPWDPSSWDHDFYAFTKSIITIKKTYHDLFLQNPIFISREPVCFYKAIHDHKILCIVNGEHAQSLVIPQEHQGTYINLLSNEKILIHDTINLEAYDVYLYLKEVTDETNHS
jgi:glycosidase